MKTIKRILLLSSISISCFAQFGLTPAQRDSINKLTSEDYYNMVEQLGIDRSIIRRGPSGNPNDANAANSSEEKVNKYTLPDPLILKNGQKVKNLKDWTEKRRPELVTDFENEIYGRLPQNLPAVNWQVISEKDTLIGNQAIIQKILKGIVDNSAFPAIKVEINLLLVTPAKASKAVPVVVEFGYIRSPFNPGPIKPIGLGSSSEPTWQEQLVSRGWGYAIIEPSSIQADNGAGLIKGIIGLVNKGGRRKPDEWGALRA